MADDLRALLADLPVASVPTPPGHVALVRRLPDDTEADLDALDAWVTEHGGRMRKAPPAQSSGLRSGRVMARTQPGETYYVLPVSALAAEKD